MGKVKLSKYEKEKIILSSEGDAAYSVYTYNLVFKRRFTEYSRKYPECCCLVWEDRKTGSKTHVIDKKRLFIQFTGSYSEDRCEAVRKRV